MRDWASRMRRSVRCTALSASGRIARASTRPPPLSVPAISSEPTAFGTASDSPVSVDSSTSVAPSVTRASTGTRSPGRSRIMSPARSAATSTSDPSARRACVGAPAISASTARRVRSRAKCSIAPAAEKRKSRSRPSRGWPTAHAPAAAASMSRWTSTRRWRTSACHASSAASHPPATQPSAASARKPASPAPAFSQAAAPRPSAPQMADWTARARQEWSSWPWSWSCPMRRGCATRGARSTRVIAGWMRVDRRRDHATMSRMTSRTEIPVARES